jgi:hypothetical protein
VVVEVLLKRWIVRGPERTLIAEVDAHGVPGASRASYLMCDSEQSIRRLWNFPDDWHRMEDASLLALFHAPYVQAGTPKNDDAGQLVALSY